MHVFLCEVGKFVSLIPHCVYSVVHTFASGWSKLNEATNNNRFCRLGSYICCWPGAEVPGLLQPDHCTCSSAASPLNFQMSSTLSRQIHSIIIWRAAGAGCICRDARMVTIYYGLVPAPCILFPFTDECEVIHLFKVGFGRGYRRNVLVRVYAVNLL